MEMELKLREGKAEENMLWRVLLGRTKHSGARVHNFRR